MSIDNANDDQPNRIKRIVIGAISTLVLAVAGSALWDFLFKPIFLIFGDSIVELTNFGSKTLSDSMYAEIARGNYERAGTFVLAAVEAAILASVMVTVIFGPLLRKRLSLAKQNVSTLPKRSRLLWATRLTMVVATSIITVQTVRTFFVVHAANYVDQLQKVAAPFLSDARRIEFKSMAARIQTKQDYDSIIEQLSTVIKDQKLKVPEPP